MFLGKPNKKIVDAINERNGNFIIKWDEIENYSEIVQQDENGVTLTTTNEQDQDVVISLENGSLTVSGNTDSTETEPIYMVDICNPEDFYTVQIESGELVQYKLDYTPDSNLVSKWIVLRDTESGLKYRLSVANGILTKILI